MSRYRPPRAVDFDEQGGCAWLAPNLPERTGKRRTVNDFERRRGDPASDDSEDSLGGGIDLYEKRKNPCPFFRAGDEPQNCLRGNTKGTFRAAEESGKVVAGGVFSGCVHRCE